MTYGDFPERMRRPPGEPSKRFSSLVWSLATVVGTIALYYCAVYFLIY